MERKNFGKGKSMRFSSRIIWGGIVLTGAIIAGGKDSNLGVQTVVGSGEGHKIEEIDPNLILEELGLVPADPISGILEKDVKQEDDVIKVRTKTESVLSPWEHVWETVGTNPDFSAQDREDIKLYYPIYSAVGAKYDISWYLLWIIHEQETTASFSQSAFEQGHAHYGAMQRSVAFYGEDAVNEASAGLDALALLPQRHLDDWREIAFAGWKLRRDIDSATGEGSSEPVLGALYAYSAAGPANYRWQLYQTYRNIFG